MSKGKYRPHKQAGGSAHARPGPETEPCADASPNGEPVAIEDAVAVLREQVQRLTDDLAKAQDQTLRALAEMQNIRKRHQAERDTIRRLATEQLIRELLPVLDNFERTIAAAAAGASVDSLIEGVKSVDRQLRTVLEARRFERIAATGEPFDPELHEALATHETPELPEGTVVDEIEPGYKLADVVLRPAKVRVSKRP